MDVEPKEFKIVYYKILLKINTDSIMDFKHEIEIKDECLEFTEDDGKITHCLDQVLRNDELQERNFLANINIKGEIEVKDEPFDIC
ncbi:hypothetical protein Avbf_15243 [Armadillidium vulgare]|nr:hypothetical protein Avbf_15243 [Armadillidium vulgare]